MRKPPIHDTIFIKDDLSMMDSIQKTLQEQTDYLQRIETSISDNFKHEEKFLGLVTYDTIFTVLATIFIFFLGVIIERFLERIKVLRERKKIKSYFQVYLDRIADKTLPMMIVSYKNVCYETTIETGIFLIPPKVLTDDFQRIRNISDIRIYNAIDEKKTLPILLNCIDFIEKILKEVDYFHEFSRKLSDQRREIMQEIIDQYFELLVEYLESVRKSPPNYEFSKFRDLVNTLVVQFHKVPENKTSLHKLFKNIIRPIQKEILDSNIFREDPMVNEIAVQGKKASYQYNRLRRHELEFRLQYRRFALDLSSTQNILNRERRKVRWDHVNCNVIFRPFI